MGALLHIGKEQDGDGVTAYIVALAPEDSSWIGPLESEDAVEWLVAHGVDQEAAWWAQEVGYPHEGQSLDAVWWMDGADLTLDDDDVFKSLTVYAKRGAK
jgi:hypothetical protein